MPWTMRLLRRTLREESPITYRLTTSYTNSTTDDALALFREVMLIQPIHNSITVSPEHVIKLLWRPHTPELYPSINYYSHTIHSCSPLRGTTALRKLSRTAYSEPYQTHKFNYNLLATLTPDSLAEQRRYYITVSVFFPKTTPTRH
jgi:hypothetical protein